MHRRRTGKGDVLCWSKKETIDLCLNIFFLRDSHCILLLLLCEFEQVSPMSIFSLKSSQKLCFLEDFWRIEVNQFAQLCLMLEAKFSDNP